MKPTAVALLAALLISSPAAAAGLSKADKAQIMEAISHGSLPQVNRAIDQLRYHGKPTDLLNLTARLLSEGDVTARQNAAFVFSILPERAYAVALTTALKDEDVVVRERACVALGKMRSKDAAKAISELVDSPSPVLRREAARALGRIGDKGAAAALYALLDDREPEPRMAAIWALGEIGEQRACARLLPLLKDPSESVRLAAGASLCRLGHAEGRAFAEKLLSAKEAYERRDAIQLLEEVRVAWVKKALLDLLDDPDFSVRLAAAKALGKQGDGRGVEWLVLNAEKASAEDVMKIETAIEELGVSSSDRKKILAAHKGK